MNDLILNTGLKWGGTPLGYLGKSKGSIVLSGN